MGGPVVILTTTGARSKKLRRTPLIRVKDGDNYLVIASMGGAPDHPHWYHNVVANPEVTVQDLGEVHELRAAHCDPRGEGRTVAGGECGVARLRQVPGVDRP